MSYFFECPVCGAKFQVADFQQGACPDCGQVYHFTFEGGASIQLTPDQYRLLRSDWESRHLESQME